MPPSKKARTTSPPSAQSDDNVPSLAKITSTSSFGPNEPPPDSHISSAASLEYWNSISADDNGMLGGYPTVSRVDIAGSRAFLAKLRRSNPTSSLPAPPEKLRLVADCGAGIGRITTNFLISVAEHVHVVEPVKKFTDQLQNEHGELFESDDAIVSKVFNVGLEDWTPEGGSEYDVIWNQWCVGHLTDTALTSYLRRLVKGLSKGGSIVVKENISTHSFGEDLYDELDSSVTRSDGKFRRIFEDAGLKIVRTELQKGMEKLGLYPVRMYALQPK